MWYGRDQLYGGRPYGGCTILYNKDFINIKPVYLCNSKRVCGLTYSFSNKHVYIFNCYMPCDSNSDDDMNEFNAVLSDVSTYCLVNNVEYCIFAGDMNTDLSRSRSRNTISLNNF